MNLKHKSIFFLIAISVILLFAVPNISTNKNNTININNPVNVDVPTKVSADADVDTFEFVQSEGHTFNFDSSNTSNNYFMTGNGPFTLRINLDNPIPSGESFTIVMSSIDTTYHATLILDLAMLDQVGSGIALALWFLDLFGVDSMEMILSSTSSNQIVHTINSEDVYQDPETFKWVYEWTPSTNLEYSYSPSMFLGGFDVSFMLPLIPLIMPEFQLVQYEQVQNIKYGVENKFIITYSDGGIVYNGKTESSIELEIPNEDHSAPLYLKPEVSQEKSSDDWEIKVKIDDEFEGSGINYDETFIHYSVNGGSWKKINDPMLLGDNGYLYGTLPNQVAGAEIKFKIEYQDMEGNIAETDIYKFYANPLEVQPIIILLIVIAIATIATIAATRIYRNRHQPRVITLPTKKKVDKYYKKVNKEGGNT